jgi:putative pyruvate formate lyase activating enzyme
MSSKLTASELFDRARAARRLADPCRLCPRECGVNRLDGERGYCGAGAVPGIAGALPHFGEEPPLSGMGGAGTVFFSRCNMRCVYCQNHQISQGQTGSEIQPAALADRLIELQAIGCGNIEPVSPTHYLPWLLEALAIATENGLSLPLVYNTNGYEAAATLDLLEGIIDVYVPDIKYASDEHAARYSDAPEYVETARSAILRMQGQVGDLVTDEAGRAVRGLILRHLVLPADISGAAETLFWVAENLPDTTTLSIMAQYSPLHRAKLHPPLHRCVTEAEYDRALDLAWDLGLENVYIQEYTARDCCIPDFSKDIPFVW